MVAAFLRDAADEADELRFRDDLRDRVGGRGKLSSSRLSIVSLVEDLAGLFLAAGFLPAPDFFVAAADFFRGEIIIMMLLPSESSFDDDSSP